MCVEDPLKFEEGVCGCGVADTDTDGDGTPDCNEEAEETTEEVEKTLQVIENLRNRTKPSQVKNRFGSRRLLQLIRELNDPASLSLARRVNRMARITQRRLRAGNRAGYLRSRKKTLRAARALRDRLRELQAI